MKKNYIWLLVLALITFLTGVSYASDIEDLRSQLQGPKKTIAVFIEITETLYGVNDGIKMITDRIDEILPTKDFRLLPIEKSMQQLTYWKEDNLLPTTAGYVAVRTPREGLIEVTEKLGGADYIAMIVASSAMPQYAAGLGTVAQRQTVTLDVRIVDPKTEEYLVSAKVEASEKGKTGAGNINSPKIFLKTLSSAIDQIDLDMSSLK